MKLLISVTEIVIELPLCSHGNATERYCDNYLVWLLPCLMILVQ